MSQVVGSTFKSRIPTFNDDASIEEALKVYHYGVDNYTTQTIPDDSIEGNFRTLTNNLNTEISAALKRAPSASSTNTIIPTAVNVTPLTIRAIASQTNPLQNWQGSGGDADPVARITATGAMFLKDTLAIGATTISTQSYLFVNQISTSTKGIIVKAASGSNANLQEWQNNSGTAVSWIDKNGNLNINGDISYRGVNALETALNRSLMLMGA